MNNGTAVIVAKEWRSFLGSEKVVFAVYVALVLLWSFLFVSTRAGGTAEIYTVWLLTFAIIVTSNFSQSVFVSERISGSFEILLTSGISRGAILGGKTLFVLLMSVAVGFACMGLSWVWEPLWQRAVGGGAGTGPDPMALALYTSAAFMSTASSAWLSVVMGNPRALPFVNLIGTVGMIALYVVATTMLGLPVWGLAIIIVAIGGLFLAGAWREFNGEKIIRQINL